MNFQKKVFSSLLIAAPLSVLPIVVSCSTIKNDEQDKLENNQNLQDKELKILNVSFNGINPNGYFEHEEINLQSKITMTQQNVSVPKDITYEWILDSEQGEEVISRDKDLSYVVKHEDNGKKIKLRATYNKEPKDSDELPLIINYIPSSESKLAEEIVRLKQLKNNIEPLNKEIMKVDFKSITRDNIIEKLDIDLKINEFDYRVNNLKHVNNQQKITFTLEVSNKGQKRFVPIDNKKIFTTQFNVILPIENVSIIGLLDKYRSGDRIHLLPNVVMKNLDEIQIDQNQLPQEITYEWILVDGQKETTLLSDKEFSQLASSQFKGKNIKLRVSYKNQVQESDITKPLVIWRSNNEIFKDEMNRLDKLYDTKGGVINKKLKPITFDQWVKWTEFINKNGNDLNFIVENLGENLHLNNVLNDPDLEIPGKKRWNYFGYECRNGVVDESNFTIKFNLFVKPTNLGSDVNNQLGHEMERQFTIHFNVLPGIKSVKITGLKNSYVYNGDENEKITLRPEIITSGGSSGVKPLDSQIKYQWFLVIDDSFYGPNYVINLTWSWNENDKVFDQYLWKENGGHGQYDIGWQWKYSRNLLNSSYKIRLKATYTDPKTGATSVAETESPFTASPTVYWVKEQHELERIWEPFRNDPNKKVIITDPVPRDVYMAISNVKEKLLLNYFVEPLGLNNPELNYYFHYIVRDDNKTMTHIVLRIIHKDNPLSKDNPLPGAVPGPLGMRIPVEFTNVLDNFIK